ncbi:MAG: hypothetical protein ACE5DM_04625 [Candidatus Nanoarchaeia archaeon]
MRKIISALFIGLLLTFVFTVVVGADDNEDRIDLGWYDIEDWEVAVCSDWWGGKRTIKSETGTTQPVGLDYVTNDIVITIQAEKGDPIPFNSSVTGNLYELSWYVQPVWTSVNFEVKIINGDDSEEIVESGSSTMASGYSGYQAFYREETNNITHAVLTVAEVNLELKVPFMDPTVNASATWTQQP